MSHITTVNMTVLAREVTSSLTHQHLSNLSIDSMTDIGKWSRDELRTLNYLPTSPCHRESYTELERQQNKIHQIFVNSENEKKTRI